MADGAQLRKPLLSSPHKSVPISSVSTGGRFLSVSAKVLVHLPTGSVIVFQELSSYVTNQGECRHASNWWLGIVLVTLLTLSCIIFSFTDTTVLDDKLYYGVALPSRLLVFNLSRQERKELPKTHCDKLKELHLQADDYLHAACTAVVFLALVFNDVGIQNCFFPHAGFDVKQCLKIIPPLVALAAGLLLMCCQTRRNSIDFLSRIAVQAHPSDTHDEYQNLVNQIGRFLEAMDQTGENRRTLAHDDMGRFRRPSNYPLMLQGGPSNTPRIEEIE